MMLFRHDEWCWVADDGRIYLSAIQALVGADDEGYLDAVDRAAVTRWPEDDAGEQTDEALAAVLAPYGRSLWSVSLKERLTAYAAARRWQVETGGITAGGVMVATDDRSKSLIMGARMAADKDPGFTTRFKPVGGGFVTVDAPAIIAISDALLAHVAACFAIEAQVVADIDAGIITTTAEIDAADWPGS